MHDWLRFAGAPGHRKRVQRLIRQLGMKGSASSPTPSRRIPSPYLSVPLEKAGYRPPQPGLGDRHHLCVDPRRLRVPVCRHQLGCRPPAHIYRDLLQRKAA